MFFKELFETMTSGVDVTIVVVKKDEKLTVSLFPKKKDLKDDAQRNLQPIVLSGTPDELDSGFFVSVKKPLQSSSNLIINMKEFETSLEKTKANSKETLEKAKNTGNEKSTKEKVEKLISRADEFENKGNFKGALGILQEARKIADASLHTSLDERINRLKAKCMEGSLFNNLIK